MPLPQLELSFTLTSHRHHSFPSTINFGKHVVAFLAQSTSRAELEIRAPKPVIKVFHLKSDDPEDSPEQGNQRIAIPSHCGCDALILSIQHCIITVGRCEATSLKTGVVLSDTAGC